MGNLRNFDASSNQKRLLDKYNNIAGLGVRDVEKISEHVVNARPEEMSVIYGKCINRFCKVTGPGGIKYTEYDTSGSLVQIMAGGRGISATECASHREGLLCGQCQKDYSLTMYYMVSFKIIGPSIRRPRGSTDDYKTSLPLPSPDRHMTITRYTRGVLVGASHLLLVNISQVTDFTFANFT